MIVDHPQIRRALYILSVALITAGVVIAADVAVTLAWREPLSTLYGSLQQGQAADELEQLEREFPTPAMPPPEASARDVAAAGAPARRLVRGTGRDREGNREDRDPVDRARHRRRPGHRHREPAEGSRPLSRDTAFPGQGKTIGIAGHRTTYLAPFRHINEVADGDEITLEMPYGTFVYEVQKHEIVDPSQVEIVRDVGYERLVLTACHPLYSAAQRWAVFAKLRRIESLSAGPGAAGG